MATQEIASTRSTSRLLGKVALVTGGGTGIGRAAALKFAQDGANVVVAGRRSAEIETVAHAIEASGGRAQAIRCDVSRSHEVERLIESTVSRSGGLDCAFNNAGVEGVFAPITELTEADFDQVIAINLKGVWLSMKSEINAMLSQGRGGVIVNTSSWLAKGASAGSSVYSASKGALDAMIRAVALEIGDRNIRVNNVNPGIIDTPMAQRFGGESIFPPFVAHTALKRVGKPEDVGDLAVWLCTEEARFVTGESILVDGGYTIAGSR